MNELDKYQSDACSFRKRAADELYVMLGLCGEVGELYSLWAKSRRDGPKFDHQQNVKKELGDIMWFVSQIALDNGFKLSDITDANILKLTDRKERGVLGGSGDNR